MKIICQYFAGPCNPPVSNSPTLEVTELEVEDGSHTLHVEQLFSLNLARSKIDSIVLLTH